MKAGAFTPAIPDGLHDADGLAVDRSMKAGAFTPAIPGSTPRPRARAQRSMKAGAFTPAIRFISHSGGLHSALNEGGGFHPRNPPGPERAVGPHGQRSMKAGAFTPAIPPTPSSPHAQQQHAQ